MTAFLRTKSGSGEPIATLLLAHGAGAGMDSPVMAAFAEALSRAGIASLRFEFAYKAARREGGRKPPPKAETLVGEYRAALDHAISQTSGPLLIGGKSMGGRVATMLAGEALDPRVPAVVVYGYPLRPPGRPETFRLAPLHASLLPVMILQGTRDPFGGPADFIGHGLPDRIDVVPFEDGDHDLKPRRASGHSLPGHIEAAARVVRGFAERISAQAGF